MRPVLPHSFNKIFWARNTSYFKSYSFNDNSSRSLEITSCQGWHLICFNSKTSESPQKISNNDGILPELNDYVTNSIWELQKKFTMETYLALLKLKVSIQKLWYYFEFFNQLVLYDWVYLSWRRFKRSKKVTVANCHKFISALTLKGNLK